MSRKGPLDKLSPTFWEALRVWSLEQEQEQERARRTFTLHHGLSSNDIKNTVRESRRRAAKGSGRPRTIDRDIAMACEFLKLYPQSRLLRTNLKARIGQRLKPPLKKRAAIEAINRGLRELKKQSK